MSAKNTICLVTDDTDVSKSLGASLKSVGMTVVPCRSAKEYLHKRADLKPHGCVVAEYKQGMDLIKETSRRKIAMLVVVLVPHGGVSQAVQALKAGAVDAVEKSAKPEAVGQAVRKALAHFGKLQTIIEEREVASDRIASLTPREKDVIGHMVTGAPNREIAAAMGISPKTLDIHRSNLMDKLAARTVADLCRAHLLDRTDTAHLHLFL